MKCDLDCGLNRSQYAENSGLSIQQSKFLCRERTSSCKHLYNRSRSIKENVMIVYEFKAKGRIDPDGKIDEAICTFQFIRNKAIRFWMENSGVKLSQLSKLRRFRPRP
ncbi:hypothetical protein [Microseira sp. BLCC-F43]|uniref:hypothetical protein n=1 Tax=Microseira sp. BLCC-F43 TaxID=3153602 RepID=UPI0035BBD529